jgi:pimeloyl-ACP methyl ester carboxylesterase
VASSLAVKFNQKVYKPYDAIDEVSARPDFAILGYPVISMQDGIAHSGSRKELLGEAPTQQQKDAYSNELLITKETPPAFIMCADNDNSVPVENSINFYKGMLKVGVSSELHIFRDGGHGYSIRFTIGKTVEKWPLLCGEWLKAIGVVK